MPLTLLQTVFSLLAISYLLCIALLPYPMDWLHKAAPVLLLAASMFVRSRYLPATLALLFSAAGDILLALPLVRSFELGLGAFLLGHLCYARCFWQWRDDGKLRTVSPWLLLLALAAIGAYILPQTGAMLLPVTAYMTVIALMALLALLIEGNGKWMVIGALVFVLSDTLIAVDKFVTPLPLARYWIMATYYAAQLLLFSGLMSKLGQEPALSAGRR